MLGFVTGTMLALWICFGALVHPASYGHLPLSTAGCDDDILANTTMLISTVGDMVTPSSAIANVTDVLTSPTITAMVEDNVKR